MKNTEPGDNYVLHINDVALKQMQSTRFLGIIIDDKLSWQQHIDYLENKLNCQAGILNKIKNYIPKVHHCTRTFITHSLNLTSHIA